MNQPEFTVILPVFNAGAYLGDCLNGVLCQTFPDFELICVDDGSDDGSLARLEAVAAKDGRVTVVRLHGAGVSAARNAGLEAARGKWIALVDQDDVYHPRLLELVRERIAEADLVAFRSRTFGDGRIPRFAEFPPCPAGEVVSRFDFNGCWTGEWRRELQVTVWNKVFHRDFIAGLRFRPGVQPGEDDLFNLEVLARRPRLVRLPFELYFYRRNPRQVMSRRRSAIAASRRAYYREYAALLEQFSVLPELGEAARRRIRRELHRARYSLYVASPLKCAGSMTRRETLKSCAGLRRLHRNGEFDPRELDPRRRFLSGLALRGKIRFLQLSGVWYRL